MRIMRTYKCQTITKSGVRCGKYAGNEADDGRYLCNACYWKYIRAQGPNAVKSETDILILKM